jgi:hypothetical protein
MEEWFEKAKLKLRDGWIGIIYAFLIFVVLSYIIIWSFIEPIGISDSFGNGIGILNSRLFYHCLLSFIIALIMTICLYKLVKQYIEKIGYGVNDKNIQSCWTLSEGKPILSKLKDGYFGAVLKIDSTDSYAIDYNVSIKARRAKAIEYIVNPESGFVLYIRVQVKSKNNEKSDNKWIALVLNSVAPTPLGTGDNEWSYPVVPKNLPGPWLRFNLNINHIVKETHGKNGWKYHNLIGIRIRGKAIIESIRIY